MDLARELKNYEHKREGDPNCNWYPRYSHQRIAKGLEELEIRGCMETIQTTALLR